MMIRRDVRDVTRDVVDVIAATLLHRPQRDTSRLGKQVQTVGFRHFLPRHYLNHLRRLLSTIIRSWVALCSSTSRNPVLALLPYHPIRFSSIPNPFSSLPNQSILTSLTCYSSKTIWIINSLFPAPFSIYIYPILTSSVRFCRTVNTSTITEFHKWRKLKSGGKM